jgi:N-acetylglucosaminyldiphosphoundecaprenol N-acetyl-beta-D-mannosaminyltransferase
MRINVRPVDFPREAWPTERQRFIGGCWAMSDRKVDMFGIRFDALTMQQAVDRINVWIADGAGRCRYVVTPNVDHVVKLDKDAEFRAAYDGASLILVDGKPVLLASRLLGKPLPGIVPGSDLCPALFDDADRTQRILRVFLLGAATGVADKAAKEIMHRWHNVEICGTYSPPMGFSAEHAAHGIAIAAINATSPDVVLLGLGAPRQEKWIAASVAQLRVPVVLCIGATIDFLAGSKSRAPVWMRQLGLEWLHRIVSEPRRLAARYAHDAFRFPILFLTEMFRR